MPEASLCEKARVGLPAGGALGEGGDDDPGSSS